ncbi:MAG: hypothetical protein WCX17_00145 [Parcubacteria group bacterium]
MENKIKSLIDLNKKHSEFFCSQRLERELYLAKHPTKVVAFKCMDGRIHMPAVTHTPLGIIRPYRNIGGKFDLGWPLLNNSFDNLVMSAVFKGNRVLVLVTYHYSEGDTHQGCAGFQYDCEAAKEFTDNFKKQIQRVYGESNRVVCPVLVGLETDKDTLILHGENGEVLDLSKVENKEEENLKEKLRNLYPKMPGRVLLDFLPLVQGNIEHIAEMKGKKPITQLQHGEWILAVGKGFDWLHTPNMALIVGPYDPNIGEPIKTAAGIIKSNMDAGRIDKGFVVLSSAVYADPAEAVRSKERAMYLGRLTREIIEKNFPEIVSLMNTLTVTVDVNTMKMEIVEQ